MSKWDLYFAAAAPEGGVYRYQLTDDGALRFAEKTPLDRPMYLAESDGTLVALMRGRTIPGADDMHSSVVQCALTDGKPGAWSAPVPTLGECACHLDVVGGTVYAVNYLSGSVFRTPDALVTHHGRGPHPTRQEAPHTHFVRRTPDEKYLFVVDLGLDSIFTYDFDLHEVDRAQVPSGAGCRHLDYSADGHTVFCVNELASSVSVFDYCDGHLTLRETVSALPSDFAGENTAAAIRVIGDRVYVSNRGHDSIAQFRWDGCHLSAPLWTPCGGSSPRDFAAFGDWMFCTNENTDNVTVFHLENGVPVQTPTELHMPHPLCVIGVLREK